MDPSERQNIDLLVNEFWKLGYFTVSRRFGTYLPEPSQVGGFAIDIVGRYKNKYAIGITINKEEFKDLERLKAKLVYLSTRHTKFSNESVQLFVGIPSIYYQHSKELIKILTDDIQKNIKLIRIIEKTLNITTHTKREKQILFS
jgi:hypothetical protein